MTRDALACGKDWGTFLAFSDQGQGYRTSEMHRQSANDESFTSLRMPVRPELRYTMPWVQILAPPLPPFPAFLASSGTSKAR